MKKKSPIRVIKFVSFSIAGKFPFQPTQTRTLPSTVNMSTLLNFGIGLLNVDNFKDTSELNQKVYETFNRSFILMIEKIPSHVR